MTFCTFKEVILLSISSLQKLFYDGVGALAEELNVPCLLVLDYHRHALACAIELKHVQYLVFQSVSLAVLND